MPKQVSNVASDDYLTTIYRLNHDEGQDVIAVRLADRLDITPPSVAGMLKRLLRDHLVTIDAKKVIRLTPEGLRRALFDLAKGELPLVSRLPMTIHNDAVDSAGRLWALMTDAWRERASRLTFQRAYPVRTRRRA